MFISIIALHSRLPAPLQLATASLRQGLESQQQVTCGCRVLQITELVRDCLQQRDANCTILPAPPETCEQDATATILQAHALTCAFNLNS